MPKQAKKRSRGRVPTKEMTGIGLSGHRGTSLVRGHVLYPSSRTLLKRYMRHARRTGMIRDAQEYELGIKALYSAAMAEADKEVATYVTPKHVQMGWYSRLSVGGGNCPPYRCIRSSVINRVEELRESLPYFGELIADKE